MIRLLACALGMAGILAFTGIARADEPVEPKKTADEGTQVVPPDVKIVPRPLFFSDDDEIHVRVMDKDGNPIEKALIVKFGGEDAAGSKKAAEDAAKKVKVVVSRIAEELIDLPLMEMAEELAGSEVLKDIQITIKLPDGTTHTIGGDALRGKRVAVQGEGPQGVADLMRLFRYEPGKVGDLRGRAGLAVRLAQLEEQNRRMQAELDLMRRRMNEVLVARGNTQAPLAVARRARDRAHAGPNLDDRLSRIEQMLHTLVQRETLGKRMRDGAAKRAKAAKGRIESAMKRAKAKRTDAPEQIEKLLEHSRKRIEELLRKLEAQREGIKSPK